jgi:hypothetical protein
MSYKKWKPQPLFDWIDAAPEPVAETAAVKAGTVPDAAGLVPDGAAVVPDGAAMESAAAKKPLCGFCTRCGCPHKAGDACPDCGEREFSLTPSPTFAGWKRRSGRDIPPTLRCSP